MFCFSFSPQLALSSSSKYFLCHATLQPATPFETCTCFKLSGFFSFFLILDSLGAFSQQPHAFKISIDTLNFKAFQKVLFDNIQFAPRALHRDPELARA